MDMVSIRYPYHRHTTDTDTVSDTVSDTVTDTDTETDTETEYREREERTRAPISTSFQHIANHPSIQLRDEELSALRKLDLSKTGKSLEAYFAILDERIAAGKEYKDHFLTLRKWMMQDGATVRTNSSIDLDAFQMMLSAQQAGG